VANSYTPTHRRAALLVSVVLSTSSLLVLHKHTHIHRRSAPRPLALLFYSPLPPQGQLLRKVGTTLTTVWILAAAHPPTLPLLKCNMQQRLPLAPKPVFCTCCSSITSSSSSSSSSRNIPNSCLIWGRTHLAAQLNRWLNPTISLLCSKLNQMFVYVCSVCVRARVCACVFLRAQFISLVFIMMAEINNAA